MGTNIAEEMFITEKETLMSYRPKILVADRNRNIREFICRELIKDGYEVETASDGRTIKNKIEEGNVADMLIMDLDLPYINGFQILDLIHKAKPALPVVVHALITEVPDHPSIQWASAFIEKNR